MKNERTISYASDEKIRIDHYLKQQGIYPSRSQVKNSIILGQTRVNESKVKPSYLLKNGDRINIALIEEKELEINAENIPLNIIYEDDHLIIIDKAADMIVHPAGRIRSGTLVNAILFHCKESLSGINGVIRPGIVHRLDKNTTGLLIIAKNNLAHLDLSKQIKDRQVVKKYLALVHGKVRDADGIINAPIGRSLKNRKKMAVLEQNSREAISQFKVIRWYAKHTLLEVTIVTGRTHQIRVHLAYIGFPIVGDSNYGYRKQDISFARQALHAHYIRFIHPFTKKMLEFNAPMPKDMKELLESLKAEKK